MPDRVTPHPPHSGIDQNSWLLFEERVRARRFEALIVKGYEALEAGDLELARHLVKEAQELRPGSIAVARLDDAITACRRQMPGAHVLKRRAGALALLALGASLVVAVEKLRPLVSTSEPPASIGVAANLSPAVSLAARGAFGDATLPLVAPVRAWRPRTPIASTGSPANRLEIPTERSEPLQPLTLRSETAHPPATSEGAVPSRESDSTTLIAPTTVSVPQPSLDVPERDTNIPGASVASVLSDAAARVAASSADSTAAARALSQLAAVLEEYASAYAALDATATRNLWPGVDEHTLARAFDTRTARAVTLEACAINVQGSTANASCRGNASALNSADDSRTHSRTWRFDLRRLGDTWKIENAETTSH